VGKGEALPTLKQSALRQRNRQRDKDNRLRHKNIGFVTKIISNDAKTIFSAMKRSFQTQNQLSLSFCRSTSTQKHWLCHEANRQRRKNDWPSRKFADFWMKTICFVSLPIVFDIEPIYFVTQTAFGDPETIFTAVGTLFLRSSRLFFHRANIFGTKTLFSEAKTIGFVDLLPTADYSFSD
jgi:hypothetical protein